MCIKNNKQITKNTKIFTLQNNQRRGLQITSRIRISKNVCVLLGIKTNAVSAPLMVPPMAIASSSVRMSPASAAIHAISQLTFVPCPKSRRTAEIIPSTCSVWNFLFTARPRVPNACVVVSVFAPFCSIVLRFCGIICWVFGFVNPVTCDTTIRLWSLNVWVALMPVWPVVDATIIFFIPSCSARFFASCRVWSVFLGPGSLK